MSGQLATPKDLPAIQGLWIGSDLSTMERLSISSFICNGHPYDLYVYDDVANVPPGTVILDGNDILPASMIFQYKDHKSYSAFSNFFRYKLLVERGGWWCDTDIICLKPFAFSEEYIFSSEDGPTGETISSGVIKAPAGSQAMRHAWDVCQQKDRDKLRWGEVGPRLVGDAVDRFSLRRFVRKTETFCPISYTDWNRVIDRDAGFEINEQSFSIHLWNEMWRRSGKDKNRRYQDGCIYEQLKRRYLESD